MSEIMDEIVSADWLVENLGNKNLIILDASPVSNVSGKVSSCADRQIVGSLIFDLKGSFSDKTSDMPNMVPSPSDFEKEAQKLGLNKNSEIVIYDNLGVYTSPRAWWLFKVMGHDKVAVLDGGLPEWMNKNNTTVPRTEVRTSGETGNFTAEYHPEHVISFEQVSANSDAKSFDIIDARSEGRFTGTSPEPRANLSSGSIPHSSCIPHTAVVDNGKFKSAEELTKIYTDVAATGANTVYSCGSGLTACIIMMAGRRAGIDSLKVYDGSWTEWATRNELFVEAS